VPLSCCFGTIWRKENVADSLLGDLGHRIASIVALGQRFWA
jgi:hypothetical protein